MPSRWVEDLRELNERRRQYRAGHVGELLQLLYPELRKPLEECRLLDIGSGVGTLAIPAARLVKSVLAVDVRPEHRRACEEWASREGLRNVGVKEASVLELDEGTFDIVICSDLVEHVEDQDGVIAAITRHLTPEGAYYLSTNNKWWPLEGHTRLPLPTYLPRRWGDRYVRFMGLRPRFDIYPLSLSGLLRLLERHGLTWALKPPVHPHTALYRLGARIVAKDPVFWNLANAFQVIGTLRARG